MAKLKQRLNELRKVKKARAKTRAMAIDQTPGSQEKKGAVLKEKSPPKSFKEKRKDWIKHYSENPGLNAPAGEIANIIDGLTPDGFDKKGNKVSFVERGKSFTGLSGLKDL
ncbi:hypothetical protein ES703_21637 [subsurface metagenome]